MRSPTELLARFNRQLLVDGVDLSAQQSLARWSAVVATDGSTVTAQASSAALSYLAGAGCGEVSGPGATDAAAVDTEVVELLEGSAAQPPVAHMFLASRSYGISLDIIATNDSEGWTQGRSTNARVCTVTFDLGRPAVDEDGPFVGAFAADLLLNHLLGLEPLPAIVRLTMHDGAEPELFAEPGHDMVSAASATGVDEGTVDTPGFSLQSLASAPAEFAKVLDDCRACYPNEACGFVIERDGRLETVVCENLQDRYHQLDPTTYRRTARTAFKLNEMKIARAVESGARLVSIYHSHCDAGAYFSDEDVQCALLDGQPLFADVAYLVVSVYGGELRATELYGFDASAGTYKPLRHPAEVELARARDNYRTAVRDKSTGAWTWDLDTGEMDIDPALKAQLGYTDDEIRDEPGSWFNRLLPDERQRLRDRLRELLNGETPLIREEVRLQHRDGSYMWARITAAVENGVGAKGVVTGTQEDITASKMAETEVLRAERLDQLTGLLRIDAFIDGLEGLIATGKSGTLCVCSLIDFRAVNDRFDRATGDDALVAIAGLLEDHLPYGALVGRLAGDLFGFVVAKSGDAARRDLVETSEALHEEVFVARDGTDYSLSARFSYGEVKQGGETGQDWLDRVMSGFKNDGRPGVVLLP